MCNTKLYHIKFLILEQCYWLPTPCFSSCKVMFLGLEISAKVLNIWLSQMPITSSIVSLHIYHTELLFISTCFSQHLSFVQTYHLDTLWLFTHFNCWSAVYFRAIRGVKFLPPQYSPIHPLKCWHIINYILNTNFSPCRQALLTPNITILE